VLRTPRTGDDVLPTDIAASLARSDEREFSPADIHAARRILANKPAWLVPDATGELCLVDLVYAPAGERTGSAVLPPTLSTSCAPQTAARNGGLVETQSANTASRAVRVVGVAADGVRMVTVLVSRGAPVVADVIRNGYEVVVRKPVSLRFAVYARGHHSTQTVPIAVPPQLLGRLPRRKNASK